MNEITTQKLHSRPNVSTLRSSTVFIRGDLMLKLMTLYTVKVTSSTNLHLVVIHRVEIIHMSKFNPGAVEESPPAGIEPSYVFAMPVQCSDH